MPIIEPEKQEKKLSSYLDEKKYKKVLIVFWHGVGDVVQFLNIFDKLKELYPEIHFDIALQKGLDQETMIPDAVLIENLDNIEDGYDLTVLINFPVEVDPELTKSELCCKNELGIEPVSGHKKLPEFPSPLVAVHFNLTCLPGLANPTKEVAEKIWNEIREAGFIPIECHFHHVFDNPENKMFDFVDSTVRGCQAHISSLIGLLGASRAFIGVVSGPFHTALSVLPPENILYLEKDIALERFTHNKVAKVDLKDYKDGSVKEFLENLKNNGKI